MFQSSADDHICVARVVYHLKQNCLERNLVHLSLFCESACAPCRVIILSRLLPIYSQIPKSSFQQVHRSKSFKVQPQAGEVSQSGPQRSAALHQRRNTCSNSGEQRDLLSLSRRGNHVFRHKLKLKKRKLPNRAETKKSTNMCAINKTIVHLKH